MKIKRKVEMNLPQLIEWIWDNNVRGKRFETITQEGPPGIVRVTDGRGILTDRKVFEGELFTIEVEEEITEDTVLPKLVERWKHDDEGDEAFRYVEHDDKSINRVLFANPESVETTHLYIENDNQELVLIWRDGKLVE